MATSIPKNYPLQEGTTTFTYSTKPLYSVSVAKALHPEIEAGDDEEVIETGLLTNPVPSDFTEHSLQLLETIKEYKGDDVLKSKVISLFLKRKWENHAYKFYLL